MAFQYLADVTAPGAPDEIVDWFATFQAWMTGLVGWTVESGGGTTDLVLSSLGEPPGALTMLFLHVYRDGGLPNRVRIEVMNDAVGTQETAELGYLDGAGAQFAFWMSGDLDAINVCFRGGATYHSIYAGLVMPFALTVPDETYRMIVTSTQITGSILRDSGGVWDVDDALHDSAVMDDALIDRFDSSFPLCGTFFGDSTTIAGQLLHISGFIEDPGIVIMDTLTTGRPGATSTWIVLRDRDARRYAMRTGGVLPAGMPDSANFAAVTGVAANYTALWAALSAHLTGRGWTDLGDPGHPGMDDGRLYFSTGESGVDEIYIGYDMNIFATDELYPYVQDDAAGTNLHPTWAAYLDAADFPINYWICGDRDCCVLVFQRPVGYTMMWSGLLPAFAPGLLAPYSGPTLSPYQLFVACQSGAPWTEFRAGLLRGHDGLWNKNPEFADDGAIADNSNPNAYDGTTYLVWPLLAYDIIAGDSEILGQLRYVGYSSGGGIASMDTITIGAQVYTIFFSIAGGNFCVRTT